VPTLPPLPIALVGLGRMGRLHLSALDDVTEVDVVALAEPSADAMGAAAMLRPAAARYANVDDALAHPGLEGCIVATPTPTHPDVVEAALEAGLHILCEKPLSLDPARGDRVAAIAAERGRVLQTGFWRRFSPPWRTAKLHLDRNEIGAPLLLRLAQWDGDPPPPAFCDPAVSGGLAVDCGVHEYDLAEWLTGRRITRVSAWSLPIVDPAVGQSGDVDNLVAVLELDGGGVATVDLSRNARFGDDVRTEVLGSSGALLIDSLPVGRARIGTSGGLEILAESEVDDVMADGVAGQARAFAAAARGCTGDVPTAEASSRATRIGQAVIDAARSGRPVEIASEFPNS
jgi:myo-inositol 2-dehydrogenase / D-chiro-inositol 1-dehydrogenase